MTKDGNSKLRNNNLVVRMAERNKQEEQHPGGGRGGVGGAQALLQEQLARAIRADSALGHRPPAARVVEYELDGEDGDGGDGGGRTSEGTEVQAGVKRKREAADDAATGGRARGVVCESCGKREARYRCPRCERRSCGVACVRRHKEETGCSGIRDRTSFVPLRAMTDGHLHSGTAMPSVRVGRDDADAVGDVESCVLCSTVVMTCQDFNFLQDCMRVADVTHLNRPKMDGLVSKRYVQTRHESNRRPPSGSMRVTCCGRTDSASSSISVGAGGSACTSYHRE